jgi:hypothetical protein
MALAVGNALINMIECCKSGAGAGNRPILFVAYGLESKAVAYIRTSGDVTKELDNRARAA